MAISPLPEGCSDCIASERCSRIKLSCRNVCESCSCASLSPKPHCARLGRSRALGLRKGSSHGDAKLLCLRLAKTGVRARIGGQACSDFLARICRYVPRLKAQLRPKVLLRGSRARWPRCLGCGCAFVKRSATSRRGSAEAGDKPLSVRWLRWKRSARLRRRGNLGPPFRERLLRFHREC